MDNRITSKHAHHPDVAALSLSLSLSLTHSLSLTQMLSSRCVALQSVRIHPDPVLIIWILLLNIIEYIWDANAQYGFSGA